MLFNQIPSLLYKGCGITAPFLSLYSHDTSILFINFQGITIALLVSLHHKYVVLTL